LNVKLLILVFVIIFGSLVSVNLVNAKYCCEKSLSGGYCALENNEGDCDVNFLSAEVINDCSETSFCDDVCCIVEGVCQSNMYGASECERSGGEIGGYGTCNEVDKCNSGCCDLESTDCMVVSESKCDYEAEKSNLRHIDGLVGKGDYSFEEGLDEIACINKCGGEGCCELGGGLCRESIESECRGVFSARSCGSIDGCDEKEKFDRVCYEGDVHWINSFGDVGNVVRVGDVDDNPYLDFKQINGECGSGVCGCETDLDVCGKCSNMDLKCIPNKCDGHGEGETWCEYNYGEYDLGSSHFVYTCLNGEKGLFDVCGAYRESVCSGEEGNKYCKDNNWENCGYCVGDECSRDSCESLGDCKYTERVYEKDIVVRGKIALENANFGGSCGPGETITIENIPYSCNSAVFNEEYEGGELKCLESSIKDMEDFRFKEKPLFGIGKVSGELDRIDTSDDDIREDSWDLKVHECGEDTESLTAEWEARGKVYLNLSKCIPEYAPGNTELCEGCVKDIDEGYYEIFPDLQVCSKEECESLGDCKFNSISKDILIPIVVDCSMYTYTSCINDNKCRWVGKSVGSGYCEDVNINGIDCGDYSNDEPTCLLTDKCKWVSVWNTNLKTFSGVCTDKFGAGSVITKKVNVNTCNAEVIPENGDCGECNKDFCNKYSCESLGENCEYDDRYLFCYNKYYSGIPNIGYWREKFEEQGISGFGEYSIKDVNGVKILSMVSPYNVEVGVKTNEPVEECRYGFDLEDYNNMDSMVSADYDYLDCRTLDPNLLNEPRNVKWYVGLDLDVGKDYNMFVICKNFNGKSGKYVIGFRTTEEVDVEVPKIGFLLRGPVTVSSENYDLKFYVNEESKCRFIKGDGGFDEMEEAMCNGFGKGMYADWYECEAGIRDLILDEEVNVKVGCKDDDGNIGYGNIAVIRGEFGVPVILIIYRGGDDLPTDLNLKTNINTVCKWDLDVTGSDYNEMYEGMVNEFSETGGKEHRTEINVNKLFVGCKDIVSSNVVLQEYEFV